MKKPLNYFAPVVEIVEVAIESGIAQSSAPGAPGGVDYNPDEDNIDI